MDQCWCPNSLRTGHSSGSLGSMDDRAEYMHCLAQQQLENISVADILEQDYDHNGFLYKRAQEKVTDNITERISLCSKWQLRYVILYHEYVLYYKNDRCTKPKGVFSLRGYNRVLRADEMTSANIRWAFKIIGLKSDYRTWYFSAASEREMRLWMAYFKVTMEKAIHGKARDKSLRILNDLKYTERKLAREEGLPTGPGPIFEPGIYEDIEEPLEDVEYLHPKPEQSFVRQLPTPPDSPHCSKPRQTPQRIQSPLQLPRQEPIRRESGLSITSVESGDYILPSDVNTNEEEEEPPRKVLPALPVGNDRGQTRQPPRPSPQNNNTQRQGPEGNSFRTKKFVEVTNASNNLQEMRAALKPVVPTKPTSLDLKPRPPAKPETALKPNAAARVVKQPASPPSDGQARREPLPAPRALPQPVSPRQQAMPRPVSPRQQAMPRPATRTDLLPSSCQLNSTDKKFAEGKLYEHRVDGMYLIRQSASSGQQVLMVYHESLNQCKHYKIFTNAMNSVSLTTEPVFQTTLQLLRHYCTNPLPNTHVQLSRPYPG